MLAYCSTRLLRLSSQIVNKTFFAATAIKSLSAVQTVNLAYTVYDGKNQTSGLPPLIIMHGLFGSKSNWRSISQRLAENVSVKRKIFTLDARNHGDSPHSPDHTYAHLAQDVVEFLKQQNLNKVCVLGHSMGGKTMIYLALNFPEIVDRLIIVDSNVINVRDASKSYGTVFKMLKSVELSPELTKSEGRKRTEEEFNKYLHPVMVGFLLQNLIKLENGSFGWKFNVTALESNIKTIMDFPEDVLNSRQYTGPVLLIAGQKAGYVQESDLEALRKAFPNITVSWIDSGHLVHFEKPDEFLSLVVNFLS